jgi:hypothetical protein
MIVWLFVFLLFLGVVSGTFDLSQDRVESREFWLGDWPKVSPCWASGVREGSDMVGLYLEKDKIFVGLDLDPVIYRFTVGRFAYCQGV